MKVIEISGRSQWKKFTSLPWDIYKYDKNWVPPLLMEFEKQMNPVKNPFFKDARVKYWIAERNGKVVGRIAAIINNRHNRHFNDRVGFFGFFECIDEQQAACHLFSVAQHWLIENGIDTMRGPVNLSANYESGLLVEGYDSSPVLQMPYNPPYYKRLIEENSFVKNADLLAYELNIEDVLNDKKFTGQLHRISGAIVEKDNIRFRNFNIHDYDNEVEKIRILFNDYMDSNWGFVPVSGEEFIFLAASMKHLLIKDMAFFAEVNGVPVGFAIVLPDINQVFKKMNGRMFPTGILKYLYYKNRVKALRFVLLGVAKGYRRRGLEGVFYEKLMNTAHKLGYKVAELSWISETNEILIKSLEKIKARQYKTYRVYEKCITS